MVEKDGGLAYQTPKSSTFKLCIIHDPSRRSRCFLSTMQMYLFHVLYVLSDIVSIATYHLFIYARLRPHHSLMCFYPCSEWLVPYMDYV